MSLVIIRVPAEYMRDDATEWQKGIVEIIKSKVSDYKRFGNATLFLPSDCHPETRQRLFEIEIKGE
ncbi:hypothetical protein PHB09_023 [Pseudomonas phage PHB09]|uniref:Uncharacterized protein n=1 Tax=Pseudomonas phage PHB09 TaxID=2867265 RepID=A0AAE8XC75_9CAUD|nr:hypothetical protein QGX10_gp023 [Pseudomonas phage PHB09]UAV84519.1 hypothetical protein PHB09_023 [Pseudomonas phage PHB09]